MNKQAWLDRLQTVGVLATLAAGAAARVVLDTSKAKFKELGVELKTKGREALRDFLEEDDRGNQA
jgi:hypothetical protein